MEHFGRYELRRRLGVGGMAEVYEAVAFAEHGIEKPLVIKRILEEHSSDESFQEMFVDEARVAMRLNHPNVVQVFDFGKAEGRYFLAMELVRGKDLAGIITRAQKEDRVIPAGVAIFIAGEAAKGLDHAHRLSGSDGKPLNIVHRDVSPQNILISTEGAVKVGDFGIAKFSTRAGKTQVATVRGKVRYMSPEQAEGSELDGRSDLFSLAVVLYEMITGKCAFDGRTDLDVLDAVRRCEPKKPSEITSVPGGLEDILMRALSRDPKFRYARGNEFQRELESFAVDKGLRATSGALAEFLGSLFPEIEQRNSASDGATAIFKLPEPKKPEGRTRMRRVVADDGMPVFVSEEVRIEDSAETRESQIRGSDDAEDTTARGPEEVTATREAAGPVGEITNVASYRAEDTVPPGVSAPRGTRDETVVRAPSKTPPPGGAERARTTFSDMRRPSQGTTSSRGTPRPPPSSPRPAEAPPAWPPPMRARGEPATTPAPRPAPPEPEDDPVSLPTFERAPLNPVVAESLRERARDPAYIRIGGGAVAVLILGLFVYTFVEPYLPGRKRGGPAGAVSANGALSVIGRTGDHVRVEDSLGNTVYSNSLPFSRAELAPGSYSVTVEGPFDGRKVSGTIVVAPGHTEIFDANALASARPPGQAPPSPAPTGGSR